MYLYLTPLRSFTLYMYVQVGSLDDVYHFVHEESPVRERRNIDILHPKHNHLAAEEHVSIVLIE